MTGYPETHQTLVNLIGLQPQLPPVVLRALQLTTVPFSVIHGLRTADEERALVAAGKSKTMDSRHITGHAVDVCAFTNGKPDWTPTFYYQIALAFRQASVDEKTPLTWGGSWDTLLSNVSDNPEADVRAYNQRQYARGNHSPLDDLGHFELNRHTYP